MYQDLLSNYTTIIIFFPTTAILFAVTRSVNFANIVVKMVTVFLLRSTDYEQVEVFIRFVFFAVVYWFCVLKKGSSTIHF